MFFLFWHSKHSLYTTCSKLVFFGKFKLWVNWFKNESFWHRFASKIKNAKSENKNLKVETAKNMIYLEPNNLGSGWYPRTPNPSLPRQSPQLTRPGWHLRRTQWCRHQNRLEKTNQNVIRSIFEMLFESKVRSSFLAAFEWISVTVATDELLCLKNAGPQISMLFT